MVGLLLFGNHYNRDTPGALEKPLEEDLHFSSQDYSTLNSLYFVPNIITPFFAGMFIEKLGGISFCFLLSTIIASIGHLAFALGIQVESIGLVYFGRAISGSVYEIIDATLPVVYLGGLYKGDFQVVVAYMQVFIRMGSVVNFFVSPFLYTTCGLKATIWISSLIGSASIGFFAAAWYIETHYLVISSNLPSSSSNTSTDHSSYGHVATDKDDEEEEEIVFHNKRSSSSTSKQPTTTFQWIVNVLLEYTQLHQFTVQFYFYFMAGNFLYGGIVPFWFTGSKYFQDTLALDLKLADTIMTIPETMIILVGVPVGVLVNKYQLTTKLKLRLLGVSLLTMSISFILIILTAVTYQSQFTATSTKETLLTNSQAIALVVCAVILLGSGFAFSLQMFWGLINQITPEKYLNQASGLVSAGVNVLPSILPPILASIQINSSKEVNQHVVMMTLAMMTFCGCIFGLVAAQFDCITDGAVGNYAGTQSATEEDDNQGVEEKNKSTVRTKVVATKNPLNKAANKKVGKGSKALNEEKYVYEMVTLHDDDSEGDHSEGFNSA